MNVVLVKSGGTLFDELRRAKRIGLLGPYRRNTEEWRVVAKLLQLK